MTSATPPVTSTTAPATATPRPAPMAYAASNQSSHHAPSDTASTNGVCPGHAHDTRPAPAPPCPNAGKKGKQKKAMDSNEASKLVAARISQLELDAAGEKDQEAEIGASSPRCVLRLVKGIGYRGPAEGLTCLKQSRARGQEGESRTAHPDFEDERHAKDRPSTQAMLRTSGRYETP